ncbi:hypothetical protein LEMLEM_LOCUS798, partial [Lemmus lemmus]
MALKYKSCTHDHLLEHCPPSEKCALLPHQGTFSLHQTETTTESHNQSKCMVVKPR